MKVCIVGAGAIGGFIGTRLAIAGRAEVSAIARGATLAALLADLERRHPGIRFRMIDEQDAIRRHIKIFVNQHPTRDLGTALAANDEVVIVGALSGG